MLDDQCCWHSGTIAVCPQSTNMREPTWITTVMTGLGTRPIIEWTISATMRVWNTVSTWPHASHTRPGSAPEATRDAARKVQYAQPAQQAPL